MPRAADGRERGRIDVALPVSVVAVFVGLPLIARATGVGFWDWPLWGKALAVLGALALLGSALALSSESTFPEADLTDRRPPAGEAPKPPPPDGPQS